jgi:Domain of unknown function (DUF4917)
MTGNTPDGTLLHWQEIAELNDWQVLLLGNGLSINVWEPFRYHRLLDRGAAGHLADEDLALFASTTNFERILSDISTAIRVCDIAGIDTSPLYDRYRRVQQALGQAIRQVHPLLSQVPGSTRAAIRGEIAKFEWVFTTSYDLMIYWAMGHGGSYRPFKDHFRYGGRCEFDPDRADVYEGEIPIYYLHGALHLIVGETGATWKLKMTSLQTLLDQFGEPIAGDPQARPLLVTEGSAREKLQAIESNDYLSHALELLKTRDEPLVVFGSSLSAQDEHLVDAVSQHPSRPIAISMVKGRKADLLAEQSDIHRRLGIEDVYFFDASTHPLGSADLAIDSVEHD